MTTAKDDRAPRGFSGLGLIDELSAALSALGYEEATPVQREAIPLLLAGKDLLARAATGTGKTAAFALPMLQRLFQDPEIKRHTGGLVLVPTRELSMQVAEAIHKYAKGVGVSVVPVYGGAPVSTQIRTLERGAAIVVATPGRALDHIRRGTLNLAHLRMLVLDEADEMLDMGFAEDLDAILEATPRGRQTALFSATMPARILSIAQRHLTDPARVTIAGEKTAAGKLPRVRQVAYLVPRAHKPAVLDRVLDMENPTSALVFCRTRLEVEALVEMLSAHGRRAQALHGGMEQRQRDRVMQMFRGGKADLLVATDVAARGLDIEHLSHVVNYDVPASAEAYVHRIGRTGPRRPRRHGDHAGRATRTSPAAQHRGVHEAEDRRRHRADGGRNPGPAAGRDQGLHPRTDPGRRSRRRASGRGVAGAGVRSRRSSPPPPSSWLTRPKRETRRVRDPNRRGAGAGHGMATPSFAAGRQRRRRTRPGTSRRADRGHSAGNVVRLFIGAGREAGIRPGDLVGAITGEAGIASRDLGAIEIADRFSLIDVPESRAEEIMAALRATTLRGKRVTVRPDRGPSRA